MNIGLIVYLYHIGYFGIKKTIYFSFMAFIASLLFLNKFYIGNHVVIGIYSFALLVFWIFYRYRIAFRLGFSGFFAKISYPLYAIHSTLGFSLLSIFIFKFGIDSIISLLLVSSFVIFVAYLLHKLVEVPSIKISSTLV